jgi:hypothetical protein
MTHVRLILKICFVLCEEVDMFTDALIGVEKCVEGFVERTRHLLHQLGTRKVQHHD